MFSCAKYSSLLILFVMYSGSWGQAQTTSASKPATMGVDELLVRGLYRDTRKADTPHERAAWAYARFKLGPTMEVVKAAQEAHEKADLIGTFVLYLCHREGLGVRFRESEQHRLNFEIRRRLLPRKDMSPFESFMLSQTYAADEKGYANPAVQPSPDVERAQLQTAMDAGVAEAFDIDGFDRQMCGDVEVAVQRYEKAAALGLASAMRNLGYCLGEGIGTAKDPRRAYEITRRAAEAGDVQAMINLAHFYLKGAGITRDESKSREWIERSARSGHWVGRIELALARFEGHYGFTKDVQAGLAELRLAAETRPREVFIRLAEWHARGIGLKQDGNLAIQYAEAAFAQGDMTGARILSALYESGMAGVKPNPDLSKYWRIMSNPSHAFAFGIEGSMPEISERLEKLDPWSMPIE